jgi:alpha-mannosidase
VRVTAGPPATIVDIRSGFHGGQPLRRVVRFYRDSPRIDFLTEVSDVPPGTILSVEFPLAGPIAEFRRGIPYGFSHGACAKVDSRLVGLTSGILPAVRFTDYALEHGGGVAILDRGVPGRELVGNTAILLLHNVCDAYALSWKINDKPFSQPSLWMNAKGKHSFEYALYPHEAPWSESGVAQMAWQYNCPVVAAPGLAVAQAASFCKTSPNVIVEALRRDGDHIELRLVECLGRAGKASIFVNLPHNEASQTDLVGGREQSLSGGPRYVLDVRPQQIVTLRLRTSQAAPTPAPLRSFESVIPEGKREHMRTYKNPKRAGHPPP